MPEIARRRTGELLLTLLDSPDLIRVQQLFFWVETPRSHPAVGRELSSLQNSDNGGA